MNILVLNVGSSTLKCAIFRFSGGKCEYNKEPIWRGVLDWGKGLEEAQLTYVSDQHHLERMKVSLSTCEEAYQSLLETAWEGERPVISGPKEIGAVGHRVVHGGDKFSVPVRVTEEVKSEIQRLEPLAPLHNPHNLQGIIFAEEHFSDVQHYAVFDTAYHRTIGPAACNYPVPAKWRESGIRKYGFHGISHQYCAGRALELVPGLKTRRIITCHLGNGASLAATSAGECVETTMGFTPLDGLMMGTRPGSLDPGIFPFLLREADLSPQELENSLNRESGLKGICGHADMRFILEQMQQGDEAARLAVDMYVHRLKGYIGYLAAIMGGVDLLVFSAGVGEHSSLIRAEACRGLSHLGISIDEESNEACTPDQDISAEGSRVPVLVIATKEEYAIARQVRTLLDENKHRDTKPQR